MRRACRPVGWPGRFQVEEIQLAGTSLQRFTASFEQHCEGGPAALRGCVHYEQ